MATVNNVPQLVDKKGGSYAAIAPKLELGKFNKWKKRMLCYLARMEPYYLKCIKDGPFRPKTTEGDDKPESQWTPDERRVVVQDLRLKSIIMSCLPDDIMESVISCEIVKATWTDLVHSFEGPSNTKENRIMDLKLEYQTFRAKPTKSLSHTYTRYKTLLNELANDGVNLSKHEINTLDLADILCKDSQENSDDEADERSSEEYLRDLDIEFHDRALLSNSKLTGYSSVSKGFQPKFTPKLIQSSQNSISQADPKVQKDYKAEYKKMKAKLALLEASPLRPQSPSNQRTKVKVLMALADDELTVGKNHARNGEWIDITMRKGMSNVSETEPTTPSVPTEVKDTKQESKINELTKLVQMLIDEKILYSMICKREDHRTSDHKMYTASLKRSENYKARLYQYASPSKKILKAKVKPFPPCTHCGFNDHRLDDCRNYPECEICESYDHFTP
ncbi:hypothetical protein Tco_0665486 [Tanacetum coccineum]